MGYPVLVHVTLREGIADPEAATIERALPALGFSGVRDVRTGKTFRFEVEAASEDAALEEARAMAERLLSNPVIESADVRLGTL